MTTFLNGKFIVERDGAGYVLKEKVEYEVKDKETGLMVSKERYDNSFYSSFKNALIAIVNNAGDSASDIRGVIDVMNELKSEILNKVIN